LFEGSSSALLSAEIELASTTRDQLTSVVRVYKALGGGWQTPATGTPSPGEVEP